MLVAEFGVFYDNVAVKKPLFTFKVQLWSSFIELLIIRVCSDNSLAIRHTSWYSTRGNISPLKKYMPKLKKLFEYLCAFYIKKIAKYIFLMISCRSCFKSSKILVLFFKYLGNIYIGFFTDNFFFFLEKGSEIRKLIFIWNICF